MKDSTDKIYHLQLKEFETSENQVCDLFIGLKIEKMSVSIEHEYGKDND